MYVTMHCVHLFARRSRHIHEVVGSHQSRHLHLVFKIRQHESWCPVQGLELAYLLTGLIHVPPPQMQQTDVVPH
jgi:hypothetical protein